MITREELTELEELWGKERVIDTMVFLERQKDYRGVLSPAEVTAERVDKVLIAAVEDL